MFEILGFIVLVGLTIFGFILLAVLVWALVEYVMNDK